MARKFFITGGTGLIGRALVRELLRQREPLGIEQLALLTRNAERFRLLAPDICSADGVRLITGDMTGSDWPQEQFSDFVHGATDTQSLPASNQLDYAWSIVEGTKRSLDYAQRSGSERFLYLSSGAVYGPGPYPELGIPEHWNTAPALDSAVTAYGQAKRFCEHLCGLYAEQRSAALRIARIFSVIGNETPLDNAYALGNFLSEAVSTKSDCIRIQGDGRATRSFLHLDDLSNWLIALHERGPRLATFNMGADRELSIRELAELISSLSEQKKPVMVESRVADHGGRSRYFPDSSSIRSALQVTEHHSLERSLVKLLAKASRQ